MLKDLLSNSSLSFFYLYLPAAMKSVLPVCCVLGEKNIQTLRNVTVKCKTKNLRVFYGLVWSLFNEFMTSGEWWWLFLRNVRVTGSRPWCCRKRGRCLQATDHKAYAPENDINELCLDVMSCSSASHQDIVVCALHNCLNDCLTYSQFSFDNDCEFSQSCLFVCFYALTRHSHSD